jgi:hypothetical protein
MTTHPGEQSLRATRSRSAFTPEETRQYTLIEMHHPAFKQGY